MMNTREVLHLVVGSVAIYVVRHVRGHGQRERTTST